VDGIVDLVVAAVRHELSVVGHDLNGRFRPASLTPGITWTKSRQAFGIRVYALVRQPFK